MGVLKGILKSIPEVIRMIREARELHREEPARIPDEIKDRTVQIRTKREERDWQLRAKFEK